MQVNNSKIDISIIVPVYGVEKYICRFMESVCAQTITNFRLVVVNDQSKDQSIEWGQPCRGYKTRKKRKVSDNFIVTRRKK